MIPVLEHHPLVAAESLDNQSLVSVEAELVKVMTHFAVSPEALRRIGGVGELWYRWAWMSRLNTAWLYHFAEEVVWQCAQRCIRSNSLVEVLQKPQFRLDRATNLHGLPDIKIPFISPPVVFFDAPMAIKMYRTKFLDGRGSVVEVSVSGKKLSDGKTVPSTTVVFEHGDALVYDVVNHPQWF